MSERAPWQVPPEAPGDAYEEPDPLGAAHWRAHADGEQRRPPLPPSIALPERRVVRAWETAPPAREPRGLPVDADGAVRARVPAWGLASVRIVTAGTSAP